MTSCPIDALGNNLQDHIGDKGKLQEELAQSKLKTSMADEIKKH